MSKGLKIIVFGGVIFLAVVGIFVKFFSQKTEAPVKDAEKMPVKNTQEAQKTDLVAPQNGKVLTATTSYKNPSGMDEVGFKVVVDSNGTITDGEVQVLAENRNSKMFQENFSKGFPTAVRGKKISDLESIDRVGGASLTTKAFNESLGKLKSEL
jgi:hypothetical protein